MKPKAFLHVTQHTDEGPFGMTYPRGTARTRRRIFAAIRLWRNEGHGAVIERYTNPPPRTEAELDQLLREYYDCPEAAKKRPTPTKNENSTGKNSPSASRSNTRQPRNRSISAPDQER